jgi:UDP-N-acetylmuramate-alanine ligase
LSKPDIRIITPVYKANDLDSGPKSSEDLFVALSNILDTFFAKNIDDLHQLLMNMIENGTLSRGDIILFAGAGDINKWARRIFEMFNNA